MPDWQFHAANFSAHVSGTLGTNGLYNHMRNNLDNFFTKTRHSQNRNINMKSEIISVYMIFAGFRRRRKLRLFLALLSDGRCHLESRPHGGA